MATIKRYTELPYDRDTISISSSNLSESGVRIYTEGGGTPVANFCTKCMKSYYDIQSLDSTSALSHTIKVLRCPHSRLVKCYLVVL